MPALSTGQIVCLNDHKKFLSGINGICRIRKAERDFMTKKRLPIICNDLDHFLFPFILSLLFI